MRKAQAVQLWAAGLWRIYEYFSGPWLFVLVNCMSMCVFESVCVAHQG